MSEKINVHASQVQVLRDTVKEMDQLAQRGLDQIEGLALVAIQSLATPDGQRNTDALVQLLRVIADMAFRTADYVSLEADEVGCRYVDDSKMRHQVALALKSSAEVSA